MKEVWKVSVGENIFNVKFADDTALIALKNKLQRTVDKIMQEVKARLITKYKENLLFAHIEERSSQVSFNILLRTHQATYLGCI